MMEKCLNCGSTEIVPDMRLLTEEAASGHQPVYVKLVEPKPEKASFLWTASEERSYFYASVCGQCGFTMIFAQYPEELLEAHKKGYVGDK